MKNNNNLINDSRPHDSAFKHVSGFAEYTDDIKEPEGTLFGAIGWSRKANAIIKKIDLNEVKKSAGVISAGHDAVTSLRTVIASMGLTIEIVPWLASRVKSLTSVA